MCRLSKFLVHFSSESTWQIEAKVHIEPPFGGGTIICSNGSGHMNKMATTTIYGKNILKKSSSLKPENRLP